MRSRKIVMTRFKQSYAKSNEEAEAEDLISKLPDSLLIQILSLLPEADANRTRVLSKRWKDLCAFLPNLHFVMPSCRSIHKINKFENVVNQTFDLRDGMPIQRFSLYCSRNFDYNRVRDLIHSVVRCKVQQLELRVSLRNYNVKFCWDLFKTCNTLVSLTLKGEFMLDFPEADLVLPFVKKMNLVSIMCKDDPSFANLVSGCPSLEELLVKIYIVGGSEIFREIDFSSPSLKRLSIMVGECEPKCTTVLIDAPNLEYLYIDDDTSTEFILMKQLCNGEAHISADNGAIDQLVSCLSSAKKLTFTYPTMTALHYVQWLDMPMFPNLVELVVGIPAIYHLNLLMQALSDMPNVEHITILDLPIRRINHTTMNLPLEAPACLRFKVKNLIIHNEEAVTPEEFIFIRYLLEQSTNLETLTINAHKIGPKMREQLLSIQRGSDMCRIEFI